MLRKVALFVCSFLFSLSLFGLLVTLSFRLLVTPANTKKWVEKSQAYQTLPDALRSQASITDQTQQDYNSELVTQATRTALTPDFLKDSGELIIDGTFAWLEGKTATPEFAIDLQPAKQAFADNLATNLRARYEALPACALAQLPSSTDPFQINCRPAIGVDIDRVIAIQKEEFLKNDALIPGQPLTAQNLALFGHQGTTKLLTSNRIPQLYQAVQLATHVLGIICITSALGVIVLHASRKRGLRNIAIRMTVFGFIFLVLVDLSALGLTKVRNLAISQEKTAAISSYKDILAPAINAVRTDVITTTSIIGGTTLLVGIILLLLTRKSKGEEEVGAIETKPPKSEKKRPIKAPKLIREPKITKEPTTAPRAKPAPLLKPKQQQAPAVVKPTKPLGGDGNLIQ